MANVFFYNASIDSADTSTAGLPYEGNNGKIAKLTIHSTQPILQDPGDYYCSVTRLAFPGDNIPIIQFCVQTPVLDINRGIYSFTLRYGASVGTQVFYQFVTQNTPNPNGIAFTLPLVGTAKQDFLNPYYWLYDYYAIVDIMNTALAGAFASLVALVPALSASAVPFFRYNSDLQLMQLYTDAAYFDRDLPTPIEIFTNQPSYVYLVGFCTVQFDSKSPVGLDEKLRITTEFGTVLQNVRTPPFAFPLPDPPVTGYVAIVTTQQFTTFEYMSALKSVQMVTDMNIHPEAFNNSGLQTVGYNNVMTDFLPDISQPSPGISSYKFIYNADSLYRVFQFRQKDPLYEINFVLQWTDSYGNTYPFTISKGQTVDVKFMFIKKSVYQFNQLLKI